MPTRITEEHTHTALLVLLHRQLKRISRWMESLNEIPLLQGTPLSKGRSVADRVDPFAASHYPLAVSILSSASSSDRRIFLPAMALR